MAGKGAGNMLRTGFNSGWKVAEYKNWFSKQVVTEKEVCLPHDAMIETPRDEQSDYWFPYGGYTGRDITYTKVFNVPAEWLEKQVYIEFEGVYTNCEVILNDSVIAREPYGYSRFLADCTGYLKAGENRLCVYVRAGAAPNSRWYPGTGIYRDTWLLVGESAHIRPWGVFVKTQDADDTAAAVVSTVDLVNCGPGRKELVLKQCILSPEGKQVACAENIVHVSAGDTARVRQHYALATPALWSPETPQRYTIALELWQDGVKVDETAERFGVRTVQIDALRGLRINGKSYKLRGGCIHHDNGPIGTAEFAAAARRRVKRMQQAGYNAIRSSHNPMSLALLEACDELGVLVMDESFDTWNQPKTHYDYHQYFETWWKQDTRAMVEKDYNHPCVIMYSIGNEIVERDGSSDGGAWVRRQAEYIRSLDPTRPVTSALCNINDPEAPRKERGQFTGKKGVDGVPMWDILPEDIEYFCKESQDYADGLDVCGMNYLQKTYAAQKQKFPHRVLCGTESMVAQYGEVWDLVMANENILGDFCWTAWEYLGEAGCGKIDYAEDGNEKAIAAFMADVPWVMAYCGDFDLTGDRRTQSYYREIVWGLRKQPYIGVQRPQRHGLQPYYTPWSWSDTVASWTWPGFEGKPTDIDVYAAADEVELFVNGASQGRQSVADYRATWTVTYQPGTIEAVSYINGSESGRFALQTVGKPVALKLDVEDLGTHGVWHAGGGDLAYVRVTAVDENGNRVYCAPEVRVQVEGAATLMGYGSGDPTTKHNYWEDSCALFDGTAIAILRSVGQSSSVKFTAQAEGLGSATVELETR